MTEKSVTYFPKSLSKGNYIRVTEIGELVEVALCTPEAVTSYNNTDIEFAVMSMMCKHHNIPLRTSVRL